MHTSDSSCVCVSVQDVQVNARSDPEDCLNFSTA